MNALILLVLTAQLSLGVQTSAKSPLIQSDTPFSPTGKVSTDEHGKFERGSISGVEYRFYYSDGSGRFLAKRGGSLDYMSPDEPWRVRCNKDAMTDDVSCSASLHDLHLSVAKLKAGKLLYVVIIGTNHYPKTRVAIRFDGESPIFGGHIQGYAFKNGDAIFDRLSKAKTVTTRYKEWPSGFNVDKTWEVYGAKEVIDYLKWAVALIK